MLIEILQTRFGESVVPFAAIALFVIVVGVSLWLTPRLASWIDSHRSKSKSFYDGMMEEPPKDDSDTTDQK